MKSCNGRQKFLASYIKEATGITVRTTTEAARKNSIILAVDGSITNKEGYQLEVTSENIHLNGGSESGVFYGIQTLYKALPLTKTNRYPLPSRWELLMTILVSVIVVSW